MSWIDRSFVRVVCSLPVAYDFVKWNDFRWDGLDAMQKTVTYDVSVAGLGLQNVVGLDASTIKKLLQGEKKLRLALELPNRSPPLVLFARFVWAGDPDRALTQTNRMGCHFIDIKTEQFRILEEFVQSLHSSPAGE